jgi:probable HAF family extracellular repeat protein
MKSRTLMWITAITLFAALASPVRVPAQGYTQYQVIDLGTLGGKRSNIGGINNRGQVVGGSTLLPKEDSNFHAFLWNNGSMTDLGTLGGPSSTANAVSNSTQVVGVAETTNSRGNPAFCFSETNQCRAFLWQTGAMNDLGTLGGTNSAVPTKGVNSRGQVVGIAETPSEEFHAFLWQNGVMTDLGTLGGPDSVALGINDPGQVVGASRTNSSKPVFFRAFLWENGVMSDLGTLGGQSSFALVNNNKGQVVGQALTPLLACAARRFALTQAVLRLDLSCSAVPPAYSFVVLRLNRPFAPRPHAERQHEIQNSDVHYRALTSRPPAQPVSLSADYRVTRGVSNPQRRFRSD